jgi:hypothetical protein
MRQDLAVYVLGAIDPVGRSLLDQHLASCSSCRGELASLAELPALLRKVPVAEAAVLCGDGAVRDGMSVPVPGPGLGALLARVARIRRRHRWQLTAAAAVLAVTAAASWGVQALWPAVAPPKPPTSAGSQWRTAEAPVLATRAALTVRYSARSWGTELEVHIAGIRAGTICQFWVSDTAGQDLPAGGWVIAAGQQQGWYPASTSVPESRLRSFELTSDGQVLTAGVRQAVIPARAP